MYFVRLRKVTEATNAEREVLTNGKEIDKIIRRYAETMLFGFDFNTTNNKIIHYVELTLNNVRLHEIRNQLYFHAAFRPCSGSAG